MELTLDTKPLRENTLNVPSCVFYASTIRYLDKIKVKCLHKFYSYVLEFDCGVLLYLYNYVRILNEILLNIFLIFFEYVENCY